METAEELFWELINEPVEKTGKEVIKAYAKRVAEQALKDASERATLLYESDATGIISHYGRTKGTEMGEVRVDPHSILSTPIVTP